MTPYTCTSTAAGLSPSRPPCPRPRRAHAPLYRRPPPPPPTTTTTTTTPRSFSLGFGLAPDAAPLPPSFDDAPAAGARLLAAVDRVLTFGDVCGDGRGRPGTAAVALFQALADARPSAPGSGGAVAAAAADLVACLAAGASTPAAGGAGLSWRLHVAAAAVAGRGCRLAQAAARGAAPPPGLREAVAADLDALQALALPATDLARLVRAARAGAHPPPDGWFGALEAAGAVEADAVAAAGPSPPDWGALAAGVAAHGDPATHPVGPPLSRPARLAWAGRLLAAGDAGGPWSAALPALEALWARHSWGNTGAAVLFEWEDGALQPSADDEDEGGGGGGGGVSGGGGQADVPAGLAGALASLAEWAATTAPAPPALAVAGVAGPLWPAASTSTALRAAGARVLRLGPAARADGGARALWRAVRAHPRVRWVAVCDAPLAGGGDAALLAHPGMRPPNVAVIAPGE